MPPSEGAENPLLLEDQYSGKIYWLNQPEGISLDLDSLKEQMGGRSFTEDISESIDRENTIVPDVFIEDGKVVRSTTISETQIAKSGGVDVLVGTIILDDVSEVSYRERKILIMNTTDAHFCIFEWEGFYYLAFLSRREVAEAAAAVLKAEYDQFGSMINPTRFASEHIERIRESLEAELRDTTISDYPEKSITRMQITGQNLEDEEEYQRQKRRGKIKTHMIQTAVLTPEDEDIVLSISRDGLVRVFSKTTISTYMTLLKEHVLPNIHRDIENKSPTISVYESSQSPDSIFVTEGEEDG